MRVPDLSLVGETAPSLHAVCGGRIVALIARGRRSRHGADAPCEPGENSPVARRPSSRCHHVGGCRKPSRPSHEGWSRTGEHSQDRGDPSNGARPSRGPAESSSRSPHGSAPSCDESRSTRPDAGHVRVVFDLVPTDYRLPLLALDATGMRVGELEALTWGDMDEPGGRWRVRASTTKTRRARWVPVDPTVFTAVAALVPRDDRDLDAKLFAAFSADRLRTAMGRACRAAGIPAFSPHEIYGIGGRRCGISRGCRLSRLPRGSDIRHRSISARMPTRHSQTGASLTTSS